MVQLKGDPLRQLAAELEYCINDFDHWSAFLERISRVTGSEGAAFLRADTAAELAISSASLEHVSARYFAEDWHKVDHRRVGFPIMRGRGVMVDQDFTTLEQIKTLPFYQDFLAPHGLRWFAGVGFEIEDAHWCVSIQRTEAQGPFDSVEQAGLAAFAPALRRAAFLTSTVDRARWAGMVEAFEAIGRPAMILGADGRVLRWNTAFDKLLDVDLRIINNRLVASQPDPHARLTGLSQASRRPAISVVVVRRTDKPPVVIHVLPLVGETRGVFSNGTTLLIANPVDVSPLPIGSSLLAVYKLTKAEARLALALSEGESVSDAAQRFGVSYSTARTQLRTIFAKTGVTRQVDLVRLVLGLSVSQ